MFAVDKRVGVLCGVRRQVVKRSEEDRDRAEQVGVVVCLRRRVMLSAGWVLVSVNEWGVVIC